MHRALSGLLGCVICGTVVCVRPAEAQRTSAQQRSIADSIRVLKAAQKAQNAFEIFRQRHLPRLQPGPDYPCDERVGRFCYWHREGDSLVAEPEEISQERERLITRFDRFISQSPRDDWITGQRIRYLIEAGYDSSAVLAAWECKGTPWWCHALRGFALHALQRYEDAEIVFDSMLNVMPVAEACQWSDISLLLTETERSRYTRIPCAERIEFENRFWQLSDPSYVIPGNDRRTEHFSRLVVTTLFRTSTNAYGLTWGDDMHELIVRYGIPLSYTTAWPSTYSLGPPPITGHEREPCFHFIPLHAGSDSTRWEIHAPRARERYSPPYINTFSEIPAQFAMFKRGDSALVIAAYNDSSDAPTVMGVATPSQATAQSSSSPTSPTPRDTSNTETSRTDTVRADTTQADTTPPNTPDPDLQTAASLHPIRLRYAQTPWRGISVGIEQFDANKRHIAQHRSWLAPPSKGPDAPQLSTLLLFISNDSITAPSLDVAARSALTSTTLQGTRKLGIYWEMYGMLSDSSTNTLPVSVTVTRIDSDFRRWLAQALRLTPRDMPIGVGWHEAPGTANVLYKSITLDLTQLQRGTYQIEVAVGETLHQSVTSRVIHLR